MKKNDRFKKNIRKKVKDSKDKFLFFIKKKIFGNHLNYKLPDVFLITIIVFLFGMVFGGFIMYTKGGIRRNISDSLNEFIETYEDILDNYYMDVDGEKLLESGISGMIGYLGDPYSTYLNEDKSQTFNEKIEGEYSGIGAEIAYDSQAAKVFIYNVYENSPASKAGLLKDDVILMVDDTSVEGLTTAQIADKVKGKINTIVKLTILRDEKEMEITVKRGNVDILSVQKEIYTVNEHKIGYLFVSIFANNTYDQFKNNLLELEKENIKGLIIDLRTNSGGYLQTATDMISLFTKKDSVIYQLKTKDEIEKVKDKTKEYRSYPIIILVDGNSASASEVFAAALKENGNAIIMGTKTFGKGKVQKAYNLSSGAIIKYTFQEWLTPNGNYIDGVGITPDEIVNYQYNENGTDGQIQACIDKMGELIK